jgi:phosphinothricin acetyltransferase
MSRRFPLSALGIRGWTTTVNGVPDSLIDIRSADIRDAAACAVVYAPYVTSSVSSFEEVPPDEPTMAGRMLESPRLPWLVATRGGEVVGYAYASRHRARRAYRWTVEVSVYLRASEHGRGTGKALYAELLDVVRSLGYVRALAGITLPNPASVGLHEGMGFTPVGVFTGVGFKHGEWHDVGWWQLTLVDPAPSSPPEPRPWSP